MAHAQPLRHLRNWIAPIGDLRDSIALELVTEIAGPHHGLLASNLGKKASTNLGAIQIDMVAALAERLGQPTPVDIELPQLRKNVDPLEVIEEIERVEGES